MRGRHPRSRATRVEKLISPNEVKRDVSVCVDSTKREIERKRERERVSTEEDGRTEGKKEEREAGERNREQFRKRARQGRPYGNLRA